MIALVTDSNAQLTPALLERLGVRVVPLTITIDGVSFTEGVDLDADGFFAHLAAGAGQVATSQPSPGQFALAYREAATAGASAILSVHIGSTLSGTVNSARLAADSSPVPVRIVDTGTASFAVAFGVWEAAEARAAGADLEQAAEAAEAAASSVGNVFVVAGLELACSGGRLATRTDRREQSNPADPPEPSPPASASSPTGPRSGFPVLSLADGAMRVVGEAVDASAAARIMVDHLAAWSAATSVAGPAAGSGPRCDSGADSGADPTAESPTVARSSAAGGSGGVRVALSVPDRATGPLVDEVEARVRDLGLAEEVVRYRVGPSVAAHTGPGAVGLMYYRRPLRPRR
ncbi:MAG: DegV family protein [Acidimicrobiales bacterium]